MRQAPVAHALLAKLGITIASSPLYMPRHDRTSLVFLGVLSLQLAMATSSSEGGVSVVIPRHCGWCFGCVHAESLNSAGASIARQVRHGGETGRTQ